MLPSRNEKLKSDSEKQKLKGFITTKPGLQEILDTSLSGKGQNNLEEKKLQKEKKSTTKSKHTLKVDQSLMKPVGRLKYNGSNINYIYRNQSRDTQNKKMEIMISYI